MTWKESYDREGFMRFDFSIVEAWWYAHPWPHDTVVNDTKKNIHLITCEGIDDIRELTINGIKCKIGGNLIRFSIEDISYIIPFKAERKGEDFILFLDSDHFKNSWRVRSRNANAQEVFRSFITNLFRVLNGDDSKLRNYIMWHSYWDIKLWDVETVQWKKQRNIFIHWHKFIVSKWTNQLHIKPIDIRWLSLPDHFKDAPKIKDYLNCCGERNTLIMNIWFTDIENELTIYQKVDRCLQVWERCLALPPESIASNSELWRNWWFLYMYLIQWNKNQKSSSQT